MFAEQEAADDGARYGTLASARALLGDLQRLAPSAEQVLRTI